MNNEELISYYKSRKGTMSIQDYRQSERKKYYKKLQQTVLNVHKKYFRPSQIQRDKRMLRAISHIRFPHLKELILFNNRLDNLQPLEWLDAPQIQFLYFESNFITSLKPIIKMLSNHLQFLHLGWNQITHDKIQLLLTRMKSEHVTCIRFEYQPRVLIVSAFMKMESKTMKQNLLKQFNCNPKSIILSGSDD